MEIEFENIKKINYIDHTKNEMLEQGPLERLVKKSIIYI